jgi:hypothetical protein
MIQTAYPTSRRTLEASLKSDFSEGMAWPVDRASLAALIDLGLSNQQIGEYFTIGPDEVHMLREDYGV